MNLNINNPDELDLYPFCVWLISKMTDYMESNINEDRLDVFQDYFAENNIIEYKNKNSKPIDLYNLLIVGVSAIVCKHENDMYTLELDPEILIPGTYTTFFKAIYLINYGTLTINSYPIWSNMMKYFSDNAQDYYDMYIDDLDLSDEPIEDNIDYNEDLEDI